MERAGGRQLQPIVMVSVCARPIESLPRESIHRHYQRLMNAESREANPDINVVAGLRTVNRSVGFHDAAKFLE